MTGDIITAILFVFAIGATGGLVGGMVVLYGGKKK